MGSLYDELDDTINTAEKNLQMMKDMAATLLEYSDHQDVTLGRINGIARYAQSIPIVPTPPPTPPIQQAPQAAPAAPQGANGEVKPKPWGQLLQEINSNPGIPQGQVKRTA